MATGGEVTWSSLQQRPDGLAERLDYIEK